MIYKECYSKCRGKCGYKLLKYLYFKNKLTNYLFRKYINRFEGGEYYSTTLRRIFAEVYDIEVGIGTYGSIFSRSFRPHVKVGSYCSFAQGIQRLYANHPLDQVSTHPLFHLSEFGCVSSNSNPTYSLTIGNDVWVGVNAIITSSCRVIGDGAVIGAGSVVTHDVEPYSIVVGNPARVLRYRFEPEVRKSLIDSEWYKLSPSQLKCLIEKELSINDFILSCEKLLASN